ncbi:MAG: MFS transporter, partial [Lachnospiraceae bacterium]|nr:MFS transporter [Lachnospiraceae bacterium]
LLLSASMIGNLVSKLALGVIIDRWGVLKGFMLILVITMGGFALILFSRGSTLPLLAGGFLYGTIFSLGSLGLSILARYLYGNDQYYYVYSLMTLMTSIGGAAFVTIIGALYDLTGSYSAPVIMGLVMGVIILSVIIFMTAYISKKKKENAQ